MGLVTAVTGVIAGVSFVVYRMLSMITVITVITLIAFIAVTGGTGLVVRRLNFVIVKTGMCIPARYTFDLSISQHLGEQLPNSVTVLV
jgi:hypothetical protein